MNGALLEVIFELWRIANYVQVVGGALAVIKRKLGSKLGDLHVSRTAN